MEWILSVRTQEVVYSHPVVHDASNPPDSHCASGADGETASLMQQHLRALPLVEECLNLAPVSIHPLFMFHPMVVSILFCLPLGPSPVLDGWLMIPFASFIVLRFPFHPLYPMRKSVQEL